MTGEKRRYRVKIKGRLKDGNKRGTRRKDEDRFVVKCMTGHTEDREDGGGK